jgi:hypothetical protein
MKAILFTPRHVSNYWQLRKWEIALERRGDRHWSSSYAEQFTYLPWGHIVLGFFCFCLFGVDVAGGVYQGLSVVDANSREQQSGYKAVRDGASAQHTQAMQKKMEVLEHQKDARAGTFPHPNDQ